MFIRSAIHQQPFVLFVKFVVKKYWLTPRTRDSTLKEMELRRNRVAHCGEIVE
jgi:hypothetical protein